MLLRTLAFREKMCGHLALGLESNSAAASWQKHLSLLLCLAEGSVSAQAVSLSGQFPGRAGWEDA